jgi:hypothetical protein
MVAPPIKLPGTRQGQPWVANLQVLFLRLVLGACQEGIRAVHWHGGTTHQTAGDKVCGLCVRAKGFSRQHTVLGVWAVAAVLCS